VTDCGSVTSASGTTDATLGSDASRARSAFDTSAANAFNTVNWWVTAPPERAMLAINGRRWARCTLARALTLATLASRPFCWLLSTTITRFALAARRICRTVIAR